jgi:hypothetical protein
VDDSTLTASAVVSFSQELEQRLAVFYGELAQRFEEYRDAMHDYAQSSTKTGMQVVRTYQETVSDALETGYSFAGISLETYRFDWDVPKALTWGQAVEMAQALEAAAITFYRDVAAASETLLATIPRAFKRAARTHEQRQEALERLSQERPRKFC